MPVLTRFFALVVIGVLSAAVAPPAAAHDQYDRRGHRNWQEGPGHRGYYADRRWRGPPPGYGYYAPPPRVYYPPPRYYYPPPGTGLYFRY